MKKINIIAAGLIAIFASVGCNKTLNEQPFSYISDVDAFSNASRIDKSAVGMYDALQNANYFGGRILIYADIRGVDAQANTFFGNMNQFSTLSSSDGTTAAAWQGAYRTIYECNLFVKNFTPNIGLVTPAKANQYLGEAEFIRSLCYFYLVNMWAQPYAYTSDASHPGVPLVLVAAADPFAASNNLPRASVKAVYAQIEADLLDAESKLPDYNAADTYNSTSRATKGAARALLSRLYLYKGDYTNSAAYANKIMTTSNPYALNADPVTRFRTYTTNESIFSVAMDGGDNPNTNAALGQHYGAAKRADITVANVFVGLMSTVDKRFTNLIQSVSGAYWTTKYNAGTTDWVPVLSYPEVILNRAEALANLATGTTADPTALTLANQIRLRSDPTHPIVAATKSDLITAILTERRIELAFEGQGSLDFLRTHRDIPAHVGASLQPWGSDYTVLPIPKYDTDKNPNLAQNHGY
jgi:tetratricopeptide (TPR) repeat protein